MPLPIQMAHQLAQALPRFARRRRASTGCAPTARPRSRSATRTAGRCASRRVVFDAARRQGQAQDADRGDPRARHQADRPAKLFTNKTQVPRQPDRPLRRRRTAGRLRPHRPQDHRRHLRRQGAPRRRRVLGQGSEQGRSLGRVLRALHREARRRRGPRAPLRGPVRVRDRRRRAGVDAGRHVRHGQIGREPHQGAARRLRPAPRHVPRGARLHRPIFKKTAAYGHFGREDHDFTWERTDKAEELRAAAGLGARPHLKRSGAPLLWS